MFWRKETAYRKLLRTVAGDENREGEKQKCNEKVLLTLDTRHRLVVVRTSGLDGIIPAKYPGIKAIRAARATKRNRVWMGAIWRVIDSGYHITRHFVSAVFALLFENQSSAMWDVGDGTKGKSFKTIHKLFETIMCNELMECWKHNINQYVCVWWSIILEKR